MAIYYIVFSHLCIFENSDIKKLKREGGRKEEKKGGEGKGQKERGEREGKQVLTSRPALLDSCPSHCS